MRWNPGCAALTGTQLYSLQLQRLLWIYCPGHTGTRGNEQTNRLASTADITTGQQMAYSLAGQRCLQSWGTLRTWKHTEGKKMVEMKQLMFQMPKSGTIRVQHDKDWLCLKGNLRGTAERQGRVHMGLYQSCDAIFSRNWNWASGLYQTGTCLAFQNIKVGVGGEWGNWTAGCSQKSVGRWLKGISLSRESSWQCPVLRLKVTCPALFSWWISSSLVHMLKHSCHIVLKLFLRMAFASLQDTVSVDCSCSLPLFDSQSASSLPLTPQWEQIHSEIPYIINQYTSFCYHMSLTTEQFHTF